MTDYQPLSILKPLKRNPKRETKRGHDLLHTSLEEAGAGRSVLLDNQNNILAGNSTVEAYGQIADNPRVLIVETDGDVLVAVKRRDIPSTTDKKAQTLIIADNRTSDFHEYNATVLADYDAAVVGSYWFEEELAALDGYESPVIGDDSPPDMSRANELQTKWQVERGQVWQVGRHKIMCGDCTSAEDVARLMDGAMVSLVITDPPYGVEYAGKNEFLNKYKKGNSVQIEIINDHLSKNDSNLLWRSAFEQMSMVMLAGAAIYCFMPGGGDQMMMMMMMMMMGAGIEPRHELIWLKNNHVLGRTDYAYKHEPILYAWKGTGHKFYGGFQTSVIECDKPLKSDLHPTMKPVELISKLVTNSSLSNEIVYDLFLGSGTTLVACEQTGRVGYGMEIHPPYCAVTLERLHALGLTPELLPHA